MTRIQKLEVIEKIQYYAEMSFSKKHIWGVDLANIVGKALFNKMYAETRRGYIQNILSDDEKKIVKLEIDIMLDAECIRQSENRKSFEIMPKLLNYKI